MLSLLVVSSLPHPASFFRKASTVTHACHALTAWWECIMEEDSNPPAIPCLRLPAAFLCPPPALSQFFRLFYLLTASGTTQCFEKSPLHHTLLNLCAACLCKRKGSRPPSCGWFKFLLWQTNSLRRVIHTPWSRWSPTSLRASTDKSAGLPNQALLQALVLCHLLTSHFGLHVSHGWLLAYRSWCVFIMEDHLNIATYDAGWAKNMARTCTRTLQHYFWLQIWLVVWKHFASGGGRSKIAGWCEFQSSAYLSHQFGSVTFNSGPFSVPLWFSTFGTGYISGVVLGKNLPVLNVHTQTSVKNLHSSQSPFSIYWVWTIQFTRVSQEMESRCTDSLSLGGSGKHVSIFSFLLLIMMFQ